MAILTSTGTFTVGDAIVGQIEEEFPVLPVLPNESGYGRLVHPSFGSFDYDVKPDEWVNIDGDVIIPPTWMSAKTLTSAANVLWRGSIRDVVVEERWKALGGLAMPVSMLRMLILMYTNPIDPSNGYVQWFPNYITQLGFNVLMVGLTAGGQGIVFDDVINAKNEYGDPDGWVTNQVTLTMKITGRA